MTKISNKGVPTKPIQEIEPTELHEITLETYTNFKKKFLEEHKDKKIITT
jgi:predicted butyrate kinase (DUF1464 family)